MKRLLALFLLIACVGSGVFAEDLTAFFKQIDKMNDMGQYADCITQLNGAISKASTNAQKAEVYWRLSRATLNVGSDMVRAEADKNSILEVFIQGEEYADKAISYDSSSFWAYYWKSSNMGKWGQTKGILDSLFKATPMKDNLVKAISINDEHADSYFVLGMLYDALNGIPFTFGNVDSSVSFGRYAVDLFTKEFSTGRSDRLMLDSYLELASHLYKRNWNAAKRNREQTAKQRRFQSARTALDKGANYEGNVSIPSVSDREEAISIVQDVIRQIEKRGTADVRDKNDLDKAKKLLAEFGA